MNGSSEMPFLCPACRVAAVKSRPICRTFSYVRWGTIADKLHGSKAVCNANIGKLDMVPPLTIVDAPFTVVCASGPDDWFLSVDPFNLVRKQLIPVHPGFGVRKLWELPIGSQSVTYTSQHVVACTSVTKEVPGVKKTRRLRSPAQSQWPAKTSPTKVLDSGHSLTSPRLWWSPL